MEEKSNEKSKKQEREENEKEICIKFPPFVQKLCIIILSLLFLLLFEEYYDQRELCARRYLYLGWLRHYEQHRPRTNIQHM